MIENLYNKITTEMKNEISNSLRTFYDFSTADSPGDFRGVGLTQEPYRNADGIPYHVVGSTFMDEINVVAP